MRYEGRAALIRRVIDLGFRLDRMWASAEITPELVGYWARSLRCSTRTVYRDLEAMRAAGCKVPPFAYRRTA